MYLQESNHLDCKIKKKEETVTKMEQKTNGLKILGEEEISNL